MARIPYIDPEQAPPSAREALEALPTLNIFRMLAHAESAFVPYLGLAGALLAQLELDPKLRELAILLVAARTEAEYEWIQHVGISQALGIADEEISAVRRGDLESASLDVDTQVVLRFTAQVLECPRVDDETFAALSERFPPRQIVELLLVIGSYHMLARVMTTLDIDLDSAIGSTVVDEAHRFLDD
jgi:alkylhydroperoxidase family enzyme